MQPDPLRPAILAGPAPKPASASHAAELAETREDEDAFADELKEGEDAKPESKPAKSADDKTDESGAESKQTRDSLVTAMVSAAIQPSAATQTVPETGTAAEVTRAAPETVPAPAPPLMPEPAAAGAVRAQAKTAANDLAQPAPQQPAEPVDAGTSAQEESAEVKPTNTAPALPASEYGKAAASDQTKAAPTGTLAAGTVPTEIRKPEPPRPAPAAAQAAAADQPEQPQNTVQTAAAAQDSTAKRPGESRSVEPAIHGATVIDDASMPQTGPGGDVRGTASVHVDPARSDLRPTDATRHVLAQVVDGIRHSNDGRVEVSLSPEELGRLRLTLHGRGDGMHVTIQADRPETQDLLRRHITQLQQDIRALGYSDVSFDFGTRQERPQLPSADWTVPSAADTETETGTATAPVTSGAVRMASGRGLDLRL